QSDEMHAALIEAVPAAGRRPLGAEALKVLLAIVADDVVLAGDEMGVELRPLEDLPGGIELGRLRQMRDVAGMQHHRRLLRQRRDLVERKLQSSVRVGISFLVEPDMAIADLHKVEPGAWCRQGGAAKPEAARDAARDGPHAASAGPRHA